MTSETFWSIFGFGSGAVVAVYKLWRRDKITDERVDLMWRAHLARGEQEALGRGMIQRAEPKDDDNMTADLHLNANVRAAYGPIASILKAIYARNPTPEKFAEAVEKEHGAWLSRFICGPLGVNQFACLSMALIVAQENGVTVPGANGDGTYDGAAHA